MSRWDPDWVIIPGATLKEWMDENGMELRALATVSGLSVETLTGILNGSVGIDAGSASRLADATSIPPGLWLNLQRIYQEGLAAGKKAH